MEEIKEKTVTKKILAIHCPICEKEIIGSSKSQIRYNLKKHIEAKHEKVNQNAGNKNIR